MSALISLSLDPVGIRFSCNGALQSPGRYAGRFTEHVCSRTLSSWWQMSRHADSNLSACIRTAIEFMCYGKKKLIRSQMLGLSICLCFPEPEVRDHEAAFKSRGSVLSSPSAFSDSSRAGRHGPSTSRFKVSHLQRTMKYRDLRIEYWTFGGMLLTTACQF